MCIPFLCVQVFPERTKRHLTVIEKFWFVKIIFPEFDKLHLPSHFCVDGKMHALVYILFSVYNFVIVCFLTLVLFSLNQYEELSILFSVYYFVTFLSLVSNITSSYFAKQHFQFIFCN